MEMSNFVWLVALLCVQFCRGEEDVLGVSNAADASVLPVKASSELMEEIGQKSAEDEWTEEDEKWLQEIQNLLQESDEDYDMDYAEFGKLINEIEELMKEHHPEKSNYEWLVEIGKWFSEGDYDDDDLEGKDNGDVEDLTLSWFYQTKSKNADRPLEKRFFSV